MLGTGTQDNPFQSTEPMELADVLLEQRFATPIGPRGLQYHDGDWFEWAEGRWRMRDTSWLERQCWKWLRHKWFQKGQDTTRYNCSTGKVANLVAALSARISLDITAAPGWVYENRSDMPDPQYIIAFDDYLVDVSRTHTHSGRSDASTVSGGEVEWVTYPRTPNWFSSAVAPCGWDPGAECPRWMKCLEEWGKEDPEWGKLLQRWFGYCLMPSRSHAKWFLMEGKARAGKGTIAAVLKTFLGNTAFVSTSLRALYDSFGLWGLERAMVLSIPEASDLDTREGEVVASVLKSITTGDPMSINVKFLKPKFNRIIKAAPMLQANQIPVIPNRSRGLSSKMLVLPFGVSFEKNPQHDLLDELRGELVGIGAWAARGALDVVTKRPWPVPGGAEEHVKVFHLTNNPMDAFLEARFLKNPEGRVDFQTVKREWLDWTKRNRVKWEFGLNFLGVRLCSGSSWDLVRVREGGTGGYYLKGLSLPKAQTGDVV
jgi:putative DNA primase/helicase